MQYGFAFRQYLIMSCLNIDIAVMNTAFMFENNVGIKKGYRRTSVQHTLDQKNNWKFKQTFFETTVFDMIFDRPFSFDWAFDWINGNLNFIVQSTKEFGSYLISELIINILIRINK